MIDVTVLFLDETFSSTAIGPMEVFRHGGELWNVLTWKKPDPPFRVTTASVGGRPVNRDGGLRIQRRQRSPTFVNQTSSLFPPPGPALTTLVERNAAVVPGCVAGPKRGTPIASVCSGVGLVAAAGLLDGKRATTHWGLAEQFRKKYPKVKWMPEMMVTEDAVFTAAVG